MDLIDIYRNFDLKVAKYIFFSSVHGIFSDTPHGRTQKKSQLMKIELSSIFSATNGLKLETILKEKNSKILKFMEMKNMLLNMNGSTVRSGKKSRSSWNEMTMNTQQLKTYGTQQGSPEREVRTNTGLPKKDRKISNKQSKPTPTRT